MMADARPEIGFVGKAPGTYMMLLGGGYYGQRLNKIYRGWSRHYYVFNCLFSNRPFLRRKCI
jgi:sulfite reductase beta subunit-like hemoprotein